MEECHLCDTQFGKVNRLCEYKRYRDAHHNTEKEPACPQKISHDNHKQDGLPGSQPYHQLPRIDGKLQQRDFPRHRVENDPGDEKREQRRQGEQEIEACNPWTYSAKREHEHCS